MAPLSVVTYDQLAEESTVGGGHLIRVDEVGAEIGCQSSQVVRHSVAHLSLNVYPGQHIQWESYYDSVV